MRRLHRIVTATLLLIGTLFFFAHHHPVLPGAGQFLHGKSGNEDSSITTSEQPQTTPNESDSLISPQQPEPILEPEFPFQRDLDLDLPIKILQEALNNKPHNYDPKGPKTNAYATFMATRNPSLKDPYFLAIHSLIHRVLWSPRSRTEKYPFVVYVADFVTSEQRQLLSGAGAIVRELAPLEWNPNVEGVQARWKDLFAKLNMWSETEFSRILFLDADAFPVANLDAMFDMAPLQDCVEGRLQADDYLGDGARVCEPYVFAGVPQSPFNDTDVNINVGSMVFSPSEAMHARLLQNYVKTDQYNCLMAEQAFLNWQFNINGAFPATRLEREYGGFFPQENEEGKLKVVHEKLWSEEMGWLKSEWETQWQEMLAFYTRDEFLEQRKKDGTIL
ncbi:glycosyltransferase family 8 protein [Melanomma pulvis-pyrius CBS 109.77]|uniref:Glycosyltransferase family 8 protein n=1 Tax=Melanomma pulvis-pyrius CBS 109.77 TaxID=1314802 RepID=A0A6A6XS27_9PLEO|nr:glycosyltransferase family 8 protein [Melanomma pulvis-pyrius CBS 109.77]